MSVSGRASTPVRCPSVAGVIHPAVFWVHGVGAEPWEVYVVKGDADTLANHITIADLLTALPSWRHRLRQLKAANPRPDTAATRDELVRAAIYPDAIERATTTLISQERPASPTLSAHSRGALEARTPCR